LGAPEEIASEYAFCRDLGRRGFPVAGLLARGQVGSGLAFFVERSIGPQTFGAQFMAEESGMAAVQDDTFDRFRKVMGDYAAAQFTPANRSGDGSTAEVALLDSVLKHHPPRSPAEFHEAYRSAESMLRKHPWCFSQSDLNPFNVLPRGVIDFELATPAPAGFDVVTCVYFGRFWPRRMTAYRISDGQIHRYLETLDEVAQRHGLQSVSAHRNEFLLLKAIWATAKDAFHEQNPAVDADLWPWRVAVRDWCVGEYLAGRPIDTSRFDTIEAGQVRLGEGDRSPL
jgi:hypothetical protein